MTAADTSPGHSLDPFFRPRSVAVVGASRNPAKLGHRILRSLIDDDFEGPVFPVNPKAGHVAAVKSYPSVEAIPDPVELVVVAVPAAEVVDVVEACGVVGAKGVVIVSAGFAESGEAGRKRQEEVVSIARRHGMRVVGPNCLGIASTDPEVRLNASFAPQSPLPGRAVLCSQSGALGVAVIAQARRVSLGLHAFVSVGNKADVADHHLLEYWGDDPDVDVILFYLESFSDPGGLNRIARSVSRSKPVVVVKSGRTEAGERAAGSHTAALSGADSAVDAFFRQTGIIRAGSLREMFDLGRFLTSQPVPSGRRVAIVSNAGGPAILCADALERAGLEVPELSPATQRGLASFLPAEAGMSNPVDMIASAGPDQYRRSIETVLGSDEVDALVVIYTPVGLFVADDVRDAIVDGVAAARDRGSRDRPVVASFVGGAEYIHVLEGDGEAIPAYPFPEEIGRVLGSAVAHREWVEKPPGAFPEFPDQALDQAAEICRQALDRRGDGWLTAEETRRVLRAAGLQVAPGRLATSADDAAAVADEIGYPVAVKLASSTIVHKTDLGMVHLSVDGSGAVREAFDAIRDRVAAEGALDSMQGVLIQPMLTGNAEVMMGVASDPVFGPVLAFGLGGIHVEVLEDVAFRVAPLTDRDAREMIREIRGYTLLTGYRGHAEGDIPALEEGLLRLSRLVEHVPAIGQIDLNPIFALAPGDGYRIVDARIGVSDGSA